MVSLMSFSKEKSTNRIAWGCFSFCGQEVEFEVTEGRVTLTCSLEKPYPNIDYFDSTVTVHMSRKTSLANSYIVKEQLEGFINSMLIEYRILLKGTVTEMIKTLSMCMDQAKELLAQIESGYSNHG